MSIYIGSNRYKAMIGSSRADFVTHKALPYDSEIEYIESTGTQYIDTGIGVVNGILMEYYGAWGGLNYPIVCATGDTPSKYVRINLYNTYNIAVWKAGTSKYVRVSPRTNTFYNVYHDSRGLSNIVKWNGEEKLNEDTTGYANPDTNVMVFNENGTIKSGKIQSLKLTDNNNDVVFDGIAVRVGTTGYLYDKVSGTLFGNDGTGDFTLGPDKN